MAKVIIKGQKCRDLENKIRLTNGNLVVHKDKNGFVLGTYIVTSFRNNTHNDRWDNTATYCSLINLADGTIKFSEPSSRNTTERRLLSHMTNALNMDTNFNGHTVVVYSNDSYEIGITLNESEEE